LSATVLRCCLVALCAFVPFAFVLDGPYLYDDHLYVVSNSQVTHGASIAEMLRSSYPPDDGSLGLYRPLLTASYRVARVLGGKEPFPQHLLNVLLHVATALALYLLLARICPRRRFPFPVALLFAVHPVHTEAVSWVVGRGEILSALFVLLALHCFPGVGGDREVRRTRSTLLALLCAVLFFLGLLSKEMAITLPGALLLHELLLGGTWWAAWKRLHVHAFLVAVAIGYLLLRLSVLGRLGPDASQQLARFHDVSVLALMAQSFAGYVQILLAPLGLQVDYPITAAGRLEGVLPPVVGAAMLLVVALFVCWCLHRRARLLAFFFLWFLVSLLPVSNILPIGTFLGERLVYLPSAPFLAGAGLLVEGLVLRLVRKGRGRSVRDLLQPAIASLVIVLGLATVVRNRVWADEEVFWRTAARSAPSSHKAQVNLGRLLERDGKLAEAEECYRHAISVDPRLIEGLSNLAGLLVQRGEVAEAEEMYLRALAVNDRISLLHYNLADLFLGSGRTREGKEALERACRALPFLVDAPLRLAAVMAKEGDHDGAVAWIREVEAAHPDLPDLPYARAEIERRAGDLTAAASGYSRALEVDPDHPGAALNLGACLAMTGRLQEARTILSDLRARHPEDATIRRNLDLVEKRIAAEPPRED